MVRQRVRPSVPLWPILSGLLVVGAVLRVWGLDFGLPGLYRPDEEFVVSRGQAVTEGKLNPHFFQYPTLYIYFLGGLYALGDVFGRGNLPPAEAHLLARSATAVLGVLAIFAVFRLGRATYGVPAGLVAALLATFSYSHVRESHFGTTDVPMVLLATFALEAMLSVRRNGRWADSLTAGALAGFAFSTKYPALALAVPLALAHALPPTRRSMMKGATALLVMAACFLVGSPYVILDYQGFRDAMQMESSFTGGLQGLDAPHGLRWLFGFALRYGYGLPLTIVAIAGGVWAIRDQVRGRRGPILVLLAFAVAVIAPFLMSRLVYVRYALPLLPVLCLLAALALVRIAARLSAQRSVALALCLGLVVSAEPAVRAIRTNVLFTRPDTRNLARDWIAANVPAGVGIATDSYYWYPKPPLPPGYRWVDWDDPEWRHTGWALVEDHPLSFFSPPPPPEAQQALATRGVRVADFDPFVPGAPRDQAVFDPGDAFYVPLAGHGVVRQPGPRLEIYKIRVGE